MSLGIAAVCANAGCADHADRYGDGLGRAGATRFAREVTRVSTDGMIPLGWLGSGKTDREDLRDARETEAAGEQARAYLAAQPWCERALDGYFDRGFSKFAVFYFRLRPRAGAGADTEVWIIGGDCPPAFIDVESCPNGAEAAAAYVSLMREWGRAAVAGKSVKGLFPVGYGGNGQPMEPTPEAGKMLLSRMDFLEKNLLHEWRDEIRKRPE